MKLKEVHFKVKMMAEKQAVQSIRLFHISLQQSGGKEHLLSQKGKYANFKVVQILISNKMVEEHCSVHSIKIHNRSSSIVPFSLSFGIKGR